MKTLFYYDHPLFDKIAIAELDGKITNLFVGKDIINEPFIYLETEMIKKAHDELVEYFNKERTNFDIPFHLEGTPFQKKVWEALQKIPYGKVATYKDIALKVGSEKAYQAVGTAISKNPLPIFIPCHRVINSDDRLGGYRLGLDIKKYLLILEKIEKPTEGVNNNCL